MHDNMKILTIIVSYNFEPWIDRCLGSLRASGLPTDVAVIDNASKDGTAKRIKEGYPEVRLVENGSNLGFGQANNIGMKIALDEGYDAVFLLNQDAWIDRSTLATLSQLSASHAEYGILSPVHLNGSGTELDHGFAVYSGYVSLAELKSSFSACPFDTLQPAAFINAAFWYIPVATLKKVGGFCPLFYHYGEDVDYANRVRFNGLRIGYCPAVFGCHDRERRKPNRAAWLRSERVYALAQYADINHSFAHAFAYGVMGCAKKAAQAAAKCRFADAGAYLAMAAGLAGRTLEVARFRKENKAQGPRYIR